MKLDTFITDDDARASIESATHTLAERDDEDANDDGDDEPARGDAIGRYLVLERLGSGGMGVVFAAYDPELDRRVALKLLHPRFGPTLQGRLLREAQALARVVDPHVVAVHDVGLHGAQVFLAMEYVEGQTLRAFMAAANPGDLRAKLRILVDAGRGLAAAHRAGLVHRDFKPDNVMIGVGGQVKVMDFGLARSGEGESALGSGAGLPIASELVSSSSSRLASTHETAVGALLGTPAYMGPEQLANTSSDARSDQFAFAVTAYELLYGERPFVGANLSMLTLAISEGRIADPPKHHEVPSWLRRVLLRGLAHDPAARWPDLEAMLRALERDPTRARRRRWSVVGALGFAAALGGTGTWLLARPSAQPQPCSELVSDVEGRWTTDVRAQVEQRLDAGASTREATATVLRTLDDYASRWDRAQADNCERSLITHTQSEAEHELRAACLRHRRLAFEQLVALLIDADTGANTDRSRAVEAAAKLPSIEACDDTHALALAPALPIDPERRATVEALRDQLAGLTAMFELRARQTLAPARELAEAAARVDEPALTAEAALALGRALLSNDELEAGVAQLRQAYFVAVSCGHARVQAEAATELVYAIGYLQQQHVLGHEWSEHALAIVARFDDQLLEANAQHALGVLLDASGEPRGSLAAYERAYALRQQLLPPEHPELARSLNAIANIELSLGQLERAREHQERALQMRLRLFGPDHPVLWGSYNNLSLTLGGLGQFDAAKAALERAIEIIERSEGPRSGSLPRPLTNLANVERLRHELARARELELRSLELRRETVGDAHPEVADSLIGLAKITLDAGELEAAEGYARDGLARLERDFAPGHPEIFAAQLELARVLVAQSRSDEATRLLAGALAHARVDDLDADALAQARALLEQLGD